MVQGKIDILHDIAYANGFCATQFNDWTMENGIPANRVRKLIGREGIDQDVVAKVLTKSFLQCVQTEAYYPSVNGGVFACSPTSLVLKRWEDYTMKVLNEFIADEVVLHLIQVIFPQGCAVLKGRFNSSPRYKDRLLPDDQVVIWHFHGDSNVRPDKSQKGFDLWWPVYKKCLQEDVGGMRGWIRKINNKHLNKIPSWNEP
jgi:hypothetical protein